MMGQTVERPGGYHMRGAACSCSPGTISAEGVGVDGVQMSVLAVPNPGVPADGRSVYRAVFRVRRYEIDGLGHVNNAVYLNYLEQAATEHVEALGFDAARLASLGGFFVARRHEVEYLCPAVYGDELTVTTWTESQRGPRSIRRYLVHNAAGKCCVEARTHWIWLRADGRIPRSIPPEFRAAFHLPDQPVADSPPAEIAPG